MICGQAHTAHQTLTETNLPVPEVESPCFHRENWVPLLKKLFSLVPVPTVELNNRPPKDTNNGGGQRTGAAVPDWEGV